MNANHSFLDHTALSRLLGLPLDARHAMMGSVTGRHRSPVKGSSLEFAEYRKYVAGDDTRRLDWRAWGRSDRYYIREFEADTNLRLALIVDASGSMDFGSGKVTRMDYARQVAGTLAYLAAQQGDAVGLWGVGADHRQKIPAKRGPRHLRLVLDQLSMLQPQGDTTILESLHEAAEQISQRALVVVVSDFFVEPADLEHALQHLRFRRHDIAMFHLLDRQEVEFDFDRPARFVDIEDLDTMMIDPSLIARRYREALRGYLEELDGVVRKTGADYHRVQLEESCADVLARFLMGRLRSKGR